MPHYEYNSPEKIYVYKKEYVRIFVCVIQFLLCPLLFLFGSNDLGNFLGTFIDFLDVTLTVILMSASVFIVYRSSEQLTKLQKKMREFGIQFRKYEVDFCYKMNYRSFYWFMYYNTVSLIMFLSECYLKPVDTWLKSAQVATLYTDYLLYTDIHCFHMSFTNIFKYYFVILNKSLKIQEFDSEFIELMKINDDIVVLYSNYMEIFNSLLLMECAGQFSSMTISQYWVMADPLEQGEFFELFVEAMFVMLWFSSAALELYNNVSYADDVQEGVRYCIHTNFLILILSKVRQIDYLPIVKIGSTFSTFSSKFLYFNKCNR